MISTTSRAQLVVLLVLPDFWDAVQEGGEVSRVELGI